MDQELDMDEVRQTVYLSLMKADAEAFLRFAASLDTSKGRGVVIDMSEAYLGGTSGNRPILVRFSVTGHAQDLVGFGVQYGRFQMYPDIELTPDQFIRLSLLQQKYRDVVERFRKVRAEQALSAVRAAEGVPVAVHDRLY